ncbi:phosphatase PAP2 family protein [Xanthobacter dioxanivorans]|uniref:Phosphatase PAP2 family protein n=1 Tax=Xanthobacter dioxanivorans TaxID=2528964 RepID=A0A974PRT5_9HYPH|nr:phosphatase PAP2 family protein [Xanthobacter dioxanivorans]QRG08578.1 phosphatase PAP2 family protein [Xanthobacter dioxanivorans]
MRSLIRRGWRHLEALPVVGPLLASVGGMERATLAVVAFSALGFYTFIKVADEVMEGAPGALDRGILVALRNPADPSDPLGPPWLEESMRDFTALGGTAVLTLLTVLVLIFLMMTAKRHAAIVVAVSVAGGTLLSQVLKWGFDRPRPDLVPHGMSVYSQSFPSGHAMLSAVVYLTLGALLARTQARTRVKVFLLGSATALTVIVGVSRIYLGVHWPTDVLGGWALGAAWAAASWLLMLWLQRRGEVESEGSVQPTRR